MQDQMLEGQGVGERVTRSDLVIVGRHLVVSMDQEARTRRTVWYMPELRME